MERNKFDFCIGTADVCLKRAVSLMLSDAGLYSSGGGQSIPELLRVLRLNQPWLTVIDTRLPPGNIRQLASIIEEDGLSASLYLATGKTNLNGYMVLHWPVEAPVLVAVTETLCLEFARKKGLQKKIRDLEEKLSGRKAIDRAKGILMQKMAIDEQGAYRYLQKKSMERRMNMERLAAAITANPDDVFL